MEVGKDRAMMGYLKSMQLSLKYVDRVTGNTGATPLGRLVTGVGVDLWLATPDRIYQKFLFRN